MPLSCSDCISVLVMIWFLGGMPEKADARVRFGLRDEQERPSTMRELKHTPQLNLSLPKPQSQKFNP